MNSRTLLPSITPPGHKATISTMGGVGKLQNTISTESQRLFTDDARVAPFSSKGFIESSLVSKIVSL